MLSQLAVRAERGTHIDWGPEAYPPPGKFEYEKIFIYTF